MTCEWSELCVSQRVNVFTHACMNFLACVCGPVVIHSCSCAHAVYSTVSNMCKLKSPRGSVVPTVCSAEGHLIYESVSPEEALRVC